MKLPGFIGPAYQAISRKLHHERCVNLFPEVIDGSTPKNSMCLIGTPGIELWLDLGKGPVRGFQYEDGRLFAVGGSDLFEVYADATYDNRGIVGMAGRPVAMVANGQQGHQVLILSVGKGFIFDKVANTLQEIGAPQFPLGATQAGFIDGYFVVLVPGTSLFALSDLYNGLVWDTLDRATRSTASDNLVGLITMHRELWLAGSETSEVWIDSGAAAFPLQPMRGTVQQVGLIAPDSLIKIRDEQALAFLGKTDGQPRVFMAEDYMPRAISTHHVDQVIAAYSEDIQRQAQAFSYQEHGHTFFQLMFPGQSAWVYDVSESRKAGKPLWHERARWNTAQGQFEQPTGQCHVYAFGRHLIGSREDGKIYNQSLSVYTNAGDPIRRIRRAPYLSAERIQQFHSRVLVDGEIGVGLAAAGTGQDPQATLRWSDDGWSTIGGEQTIPMGKIGENDVEMEYWRLGATRNRGYEWDCAAPVPIRLIDAYLDLEPGTF